MQINWDPNRRVTAKAGWMGSGADVCGVFFGDSENVLKPDRGDGCTTL